MIRMTTILWAALAAVVIAGLFHMKYEVQAQERALARIKSETAQVRVRTQALYAEWNQLNRPDRLRRLLAARAPLSPVGGSQLREFSELPVAFDHVYLARRGGAAHTAGGNLAAAPPGKARTRRQ